MNEIDDITREDQQELTFQESQPYDFSFKDKNVADEVLLFGEESGQFALAYGKWLDEKDNEEIKQLK